MDCLLCAKIARSTLRTKSNRERADRIAQFKAFKNNNACPTCRKVVDVFSAVGSALMDDAEVTIAFEESQRYYRRCWTLSIAQHGIYIELLRLNRELGVDEDFATPVDDPHINLDQPKRWIKDCDEYHGGTCHTICDPWARMEYPKELILIDVERQCLVRQKGSRRYLALSYMWGKPVAGFEPFQTKLNNFDSLRQEGAFNLTMNASRLPNTIKDSILLTGLLGVRYLWVDRFCIIQDDPTTKPMFLNMMASIYANSYFTIAACEGSDDTAGLPGIGDRSRPLPFQTFDFGPSCRMISVEPIRPINSPNDLYHTRGWTYQEWSLSTRVLAFHHHTVSWMCRKSRERTENGAQPVPSYIPTVINIEEGEHLCSRWPNFKLYATLVSDYSELNLTYPEDAFRAFSAMVAVTGRPMAGGILFGLPEVIFSGALLWKPRGLIERRKDRHGNVMQEFPSWSWLGWSGHIDTEAWAQAHAYYSVDNGDVLAGTPYRFTIRPLIDYFKTRGLVVRKKIHNGYYDTAKRTDLDLHHESLPPTWRLRHPVPLLSQPEPPVDEEWETVIEFRTSRLVLRLGDCRNDKHGNTEDCDLLTPDGDVAGLMTYGQRGTLTPGHPCELICIGQTEAEWMWQATGTIFKESQHFHKDCPPECYWAPESCLLGENWMYECYNVMWIERKDGIAYRKGVGRVFKAIWDQVETEEVDVRLD
ncbi:HET-domain-containing protein [Westerdykella ornata]|uniref:HET-domain-containing protein n=1 Tax=Westerdykella ornata TaxID=318751 RepID=A0A6A6JK51_WESOR|nr:HET-domain-containing protein [Westerdykella ornata]KAF2276634.1 HET-domain-containing protein [Westerdykella ornata]